MSLRSDSFEACLCAALLWLVAVVPAPALAQVTTATLAGVVRDETGAVLPNAVVSVTSEDTGAARSATTDSAGRYLIPGLAPGPYTRRVSLEGFATNERTGVVLTVGEQASGSITLRVGPTSDTVSVVGGPTLVELRSAALSGFVAEAKIENLPLNGRNFVTLATLQPGVSVFLDRPQTNNTGGLALHVNGAPARSNSYLLDGANLRSFYGVGIMTAAETSLGVETVQEFRVVTNGFSADYGRSMGGVINVVTKAGSNELHGSGFGFHRNSALDARNFFDPPSGPPDFHRNQFGFSVGGPVDRDRTFFFGGGEWLRERLGVSKVLNVPTDAARAGALGPVSASIRPYLDLYPRPNGPDVGPGIGRYTYVAQQPTDEYFLQGRIDHQLSSADQIFARYTHDEASRTLPLTFAAFANRSASTLGAFTAEHRRVFSPSLLNTARVSHSRLLFANSVPSTGIPAELRLVPSWAAPHGAVDEFGNIAVGGLSDLGATTTSPLILNTTYLTFSDDVTLTRGRHAIRSGLIVEQARNYVMVSTFVRGSYIFPNLSTFLAGRPSSFNTVFPGSELDRDRRTTLFGGYLQDDVRLGRVTLNLGLRYETFTVPTDADGRDSALLDPAHDTAFTVGPVFRNPSRGNWGPRMGAAWDVRGDGRTSVRGGAGLYFDTDNPFNSALIIGVFSPPFAQFVALANPAFPVTSYTASPVAPRFVDANPDQPRLWAFNASVQHQIGSGIGIMVGYAGSRGYDLIRAVEGNPYEPTIQADGRPFYPATGLVRRNPAWGPMDVRTTGGRSWYNALQASVQKRLGPGPEVQVSYTLAKVEDLTQGHLQIDATNSSIFPQDPYGLDKGPSDFDVRHTTTFHVTWPLPSPQRGDFVGRLARGWQLNALGNVHSGTAFTPTIVANWSRSGSNRGADRPNVSAACASGTSYPGTVQHYFDATCFDLPPAGTFGNAGRNSLRGPSYASVDVSLVKSIGLDPGRSLQLRLEAFNVFNRANFAVPSGQVFAGVSAAEAPLATAGQITRTVSSARQLQLGVKLSF
jgi:hypothetical protein